MLISSYHALMCDYDNITSGKFSLSQLRLSFFFPLMLFCHQKRVNLVGQPLLVAPDQQAARISAFIELFTVADD